MSPELYNSTFSVRDATMALDKLVELVQGLARRKLHADEEPAAMSLTLIDVASSCRGRLTTRRGQMQRPLRL
jgi:hypothetical protein